MIYTFCEFELDESLYQVSRAGKEIRIRRRTFEVLAYLLRHRDYVVSKEELFEEVWNQEFVSDSSLANCISELRTALKVDSESPQIIQTVYGRGYHFIASVETRAKTAYGTERGDSTHRAQREAEEPAKPLRAQCIRETFVGRTRELEHLGGALDDAQHGRGRIVLLTGEPGIGKTRTAEKFVERARARGARVAIGRCHEGEGAPPYWPWVQILIACLADRDGKALRTSLGSSADAIAQLVPEQRQSPSIAHPETSVDPNAARFRLFESVTRFLVGLSQESPLVLFLDDLHNADDSSLLLLGFLSHRLRDSRICIVGTHQTAGRTREHPLTRLLGELTREALADAHVLEPLEEADVRRLLEQVSPDALDAELPMRIYERSEGNPLFVAELVQLLLSNRGGPSSGATSREGTLIGVPAGLRSTIDQRLDYLGPECRRILEIASAIGREFRPTLLQCVAEEKSSACLDRLQEALDAGVLSEVPCETGVHAAGLFRFNHDLIRNVIYEGLALGDRVDIHRRIGAALEVLDSGCREERAAEIGHHYSQSADPEDLEKAVTYCTRAGAEASRGFANDQAAGHFETALTALEKLDPTDDRKIGDLLIAKAAALRWSHQYSRLKETLLQVVERARRIPDAERIAGAAILWGGLDTLGALDDTWIGLLEEALRGIDEQDSPPRAALLHCLVVARFPLDPPERSLALNQQALEMCRRLGYQQGQSLGLSLHRAFLLGPDRFDERSALAKDALDLAIASGDQAVEVIARAFHFGQLLECGEAFDLDAAIKRIERLAGHPDHGVLLNVRGILALLQGRYREAEVILQRMRGDQFAEIRDGGCPPRILCPMFVLFRDQGRLEELEATLRNAAARSPTFALWRIMLAAVLAETQRSEEARREFDEIAGQDFALLPRNGLWLGSVVHLSEICAELGEVDHAASLRAMLEPFAAHIATIEGLACVGPVSLALGRLEILLGAWSDAERNFNSALELAARLQARPFEARAQACYAEMLLARRGPGDREQARVAVKQARAIVDEIGLRGALERRVKRLGDSLRNSEQTTGVTLLLE